MSSFVPFWFKSSFQKSTGIFFVSSLQKKSIRKDAFSVLSHRRELYSFAVIFGCAECYWIRQFRMRTEYHCGGSRNNTPDGFPAGPMPGQAILILLFSYRANELTRCYTEGFVKQTAEIFHIVYSDTVTCAFKGHIGERQQLSDTSELYTVNVFGEGH